MRVNYLIKIKNLFLEIIQRNGINSAKQTNFEILKSSHGVINYCHFKICLKDFKILFQVMSEGRFCFASSFHLIVFIYFVFLHWSHSFHHWHRHGQHSYVIHFFFCSILHLQQSVDLTWILKNSSRPPAPRVCLHWGVVIQLN